MTLNILATVLWLKPLSLQYRIGDLCVSTIRSFLSVKGENTLQLLWLLGGTNYVMVQSRKRVIFKNTQHRLTDPCQLYRPIKTNDACNNLFLSVSGVN